jgi:hypothetical protein
VEDRRQVLLKNLGFGAAFGAGIGLVQVISVQAAPNIGQLLGYALGGAIGGAILMVLTSAMLRWLFKQ